MGRLAGCRWCGRGLSRRRTRAGGPQHGRGGIRKVHMFRNIACSPSDLVISHSTLASNPHHPLLHSKGLDPTVKPIPSSGIKGVRKRLLLLCLRVLCSGLSLRRVRALFDAPDAAR